MTPVHYGIAPFKRSDLGLPPPEKKYQALGKWRTLEEWARVTGIPRSTLQTRMTRGYSVERAITMPYKRRGNY